MRAPSRASLAIAIALIAAIALGTALRMAPARQPGSAFIADAAFHDRMIRATIASGRVPALDSLSEAPAGRRMGAWLPEGLYVMAGAFVRALAPMGAQPLAGELWFVALTGALIALPVFGATRALFLDPRAAFLAAAVSVFLPAHLHRTWCYWLRYDSPGTLLVTTHLAFAFAALAATNLRSARIHALMSGLALVAALWVWRVSLMFPILEAGFVALLILLRPPERAVREWFTAIVIAGSVAAVGIAYAREQQLLFTRPWVFAIALCAALHTPWLRRPGTRLGTRALLVLAAACMTLIPGMPGGHEREGVMMMRVLQLKLGGLFARAAAPNPLASLYLHVEELKGVVLHEWFGPGVFSWLGGWLLAASILVWWRAGRPSPSRLREAAPAGLLLGTLAVALTLITALLMRNKVLLAPVAAMVCGGLWSALSARRAPRAATGSARDVRTAGVRAGPSRRDAARPRSWRPTAVTLALAACLAITLRDAVWLAGTRHSRLEPGLSAALEALRDRAPADATVLSLWNHGYAIQRYAGRATLVDGFLESDVTRRRVVEIAGAFMQTTPDSLASVSRRYGAEWLLVPPSTELFGVAVITGAPFLHKLLPPGIPLTPAEADRVIIRMMVFGAAVPPFEPVFERDGYRLYRISTARPPS